VNTYLVIFSVSLLSSLFLTPLVRGAARRFGWLDVPEDERRLHKKPIPRLGGVAVFASVLLGLSALAFFNNLLTASLAGYSRQFVAVAASSALVFLFGLYDDLHGASAKWKFAAQLAGGAALYALGGRVEAATLPVAGSFALPPAASFAVTLVWVVGVSNAFNLIDGLDGLAAGASLFAALVVLGVAFFTGHAMTVVVALALCGALIGFLRYNFNPASIFLGDSGSLFIGFLLASLSLVSSQKASTAVAVAIPLMAFGLPVIDTGFSVVRRFISGKPLFEGDREHIHHKLLERGWSQRRVAFVLYGVCAAFGMIALLFLSDGGSGRTTGLLLLVTGAGVVLVAGRLRYHEVDEVRASVRRNVMDRRTRGVNNIAVRRASRAMSKASTLTEMFAAVEQVLALDEFARCSLQLGRGGDYESSARAFRQEEAALAERGAHMANGLIHLELEAGGGGRPDAASPGLCWTLRLPLSTENAGWGFVSFHREFGREDLMLDVNYLSGFFRQEMARAAERIFSGEASGLTLSGKFRLNVAASAGRGR
jgi:UDP-GlcNAc:undecaprenyl-phosphate GlcNAc-1-phosphate transferase